MAAVGHDGWTPSVGGCGGRDSLSKAHSCEALSRRLHSREAAIQAAQAFGIAGHHAEARQVLSPFETAGDPEVLYKLAFVDARLGKHELALAEYRRAFSSAGRLADLAVLAKLTTRFAYELYEATEYAEAIRILDALLRGHSGSLELVDERDARMRLARALNYLGDDPAAEAELRRLRGILGTAPLTAAELLLDAQLHLDANQLRSAAELLLQAQSAARRDGIRLYESSTVMNRLEVAAREADWQQVHALATQAEGFGDVLTTDDRVDLAFLEGVAARGEGRLEESRRLLEQARALGPLPNRLWEVESELGRTLWALGDADRARMAFEESVAQLEAQRKRLREAGLAMAPVGDRERPYDGLFEAFAEAQDAEGALSTLQRSLASRLSDGVAEASRSAGHAVDDALDRSAATRKLDEASRALPVREAAGRETRFIAFVTTDSHSWAVIQGAGPLQVTQVAFAPEKLCPAMRRFAENFDDETGTQLGAALFPASTLSRLGRRFAVLLPRCARNFPVAAVRVGEARLVDRAILSVAPDVSSISWKRDVARGGLVLADPLGDLPSAREEAQSAGRVTGAEVRLGALATVAPLEHPGGRLLHFATHTGVDVAGPTLVLADRNVTVADILRQRLHADLVVLASCHSGSSLEATVADTLATAFLRSGSGAVLATLRSVEDGFASDVVRAFYAQGGLDDPAGALAQVQRALAQTTPVARWSAFFVAGTPEPLTPRRPPDSRLQALGP